MYVRISNSFSSSSYRNANRHTRPRAFIKKTHKHVKIYNSRYIEFIEDYPGKNEY